MSPRESGPGTPAPIDDPEHRVARRRLQLVALVLLAQAVGMFAFAVFLLVNLVGGTEETTDTRNTVIETVVFFLLAAGLVLLARGCVRGRRWARAPAVLVQLIAFLGIALNLVQGDLWYSRLLGVPLTVGSALAALALVTPAVTAVLEEDPS